MTQPWDPNVYRPWWERYATPPQHPPRPPGTPGGQPGAPPGWWQGMAPQYPPGYQWPQPPAPGGEQGGGSPAEGGVDWSQSAGAKPRPLLSEWRPPADELTRWGVEHTLQLSTGQDGKDLQGMELTRMTLPLPAAAVALVWARQLEGVGGIVTVGVQVFAGIGTIQVPVTPRVVLQLDGVARVLGPSDARDPAGTVTLPLPIPVKWLSVNATLLGVAPGDERFAVGAIVAPSSGIW